MARVRRLADAVSGRADGRTGGLLFCLTLLPLAACQDPGFACTAEIRPAVVVELRDVSTGGYLATTPRGVVRDGDFEDSLRVARTTLDSPPLVATMIGADERAGTYLVQVEAEGYQAWDTTGVRVTRDECHVQTVGFIAELEPVP